MKQTQEYQRLYAAPVNTGTTPTSAQMNHARSPTPDSSSVPISQSMSVMAIDPASRPHTRAYAQAAYPSSSGQWHPSQPQPQHTPPPPPPHPHRASTHTSGLASASAARAAGRHLGTQLLTLTPVHRTAHGKISGSALTALTHDDDDDAPTDEASAGGSSRTSSSPHAPDVLGCRPNAAHHHRASMPAPQRKETEVWDAHMDGLKTSITANPGGDEYGTADSVRHGGGSPGGGLTVRTPGARI